MTSRTTHPAAWEPVADDDVRYEALISVRLARTIAGSHLLQYLRTQPEVICAWWIAADIDAMVMVRCASLPLLRRAISDLRLRGGAETTVAHLILRRIDLDDPRPIISSDAA